MRLDADERARQDAAERERAGREERLHEEARLKAQAEEASRLAEADDQEHKRREAEEVELLVERQAGEAAGKSRDDAKALAKSEAEAAAQARKDARAKERADALEQKRREAAMRLQEKELEAAQAGPRRPRSWGRPVAIGLFVMLVTALVAIHFIPLDAKPYEKAAQDRLGVPVRIGSVGLSLFPTPSLSFSKVAIGEGDAPVLLEEVLAKPELGSLWDERKRFRSVDIGTVVVPKGQVLAALRGSGSEQLLRIERLRARNVDTQLGGIKLPKLAAEAGFGPNGQFDKLTLSHVESKLAVTLRPDGSKLVIELESENLDLLLGSWFGVADITAKGVVGEGEIAFSEFKARALEGYMEGRATLRWFDGWSLEGGLSARQMSAARIAGTLFSAGTVEGTAKFSLRSAALDKLAASARLEGAFVAQKGAVSGVDATKLLQGGSASGGSTRFAELSGTGVADASGLKLRQLRLVDGPLSVAGTADVDAQRNLSGRFQFELKMSSTQARGTLALGGTLRDPQFRR